MEENKLLEENNVISNNNKQPKNKTKLLVIIIILLSLLVLGLGGFIVYDKFIAKEETKQVVEEKDTKTEKEENKKEEESVDETKDDEKDVTIANQIKVDDYEYVLNNNKHKVSFIYSYERCTANNNRCNDSRDYYMIFVTMAFDGKIINESKALISSTENYSIDDTKIPLVTTDVIKKFSDSKNTEYMVLGIKEGILPGTEVVDPVIIDENGKALYKIDLFDGQGIGLADSNMDSIFIDEYYVANGGVYYLDSQNVVGEAKPHTSDFCNPEQWGGFDPCVTVQEYKITIENGKAIKTPTQTYLAMLAGAIS